MKKPEIYYLFVNQILEGFFIVKAGTGRLTDFMLDKTMRCEGSLSLTENQARVITSGDGALIE